jgi:hypothetical protein
MESGVCICVCVYIYILLKLPTGFKNTERCAEGKQINSCAVMQSSIQNSLIPSNSQFYSITICSIYHEGVAKYFNASIQW